MRSRVAVRAHPVPILADGPLITSFQSGHGWTSANTGSSTVNLNDTSTPYVGTQCVSLTTDGAGGYAGVKKYNAMSSTDFTGKMLKVAIQFTDKTHLASGNSALRIFLGSSSLGKYYLWTVAIPEIYINGTWLDFNLPFYPDNQLYATSGSPNRAALTDIEIQIKDDSTGNHVTAYLGQISICNEPAQYLNGCLSFRFDDGYVSDYTVAAPALASYGWAATGFVIHDLVTTTNYLTVDQWHILQAMGWDIGCHAFASAIHNVGYPSYSDAVVSADMAACIAASKARGFRGLRNHAYPKGYLTTGGVCNALTIAKRFYATGTTISGSTQETWYPCDLYRMRCWQVVNTHTLAAIEAVVANTVAAKCWTTLCFHELVASPSVSTQWSTANFSSLLGYISSTYPNLPVKTMSFVLGTGIGSYST